MALQQYTNLNFEDIKISIKDYLRSNSNFTDFDFEGSNLSVLINLLAYNTYITAFNTNMAVNETFIDSATLRENVVSLARNIGYVPRSRRAAKAKVDYNISDLDSTVTQINFVPGILSNGRVSNTSYIFSLPERVSGTAENGESVGTLEIYQGQYLETNFIVDSAQKNQRYILPNEGIDTSTIRVKVRDNAASTSETEFKLVDNILGITSTSNIYLLQETTDERYELLFGDNIFGKKLDSGNVVEISYIRTNGSAGNGVRDFSFSGRLLDQNGALLQNYTPILTVNQPSDNGDEIESLQSVKYYAPRRYASQHRAVTASDYEAILPTVYSNIESVSAYGGEDLEPPQYGRVFIAAKPRNGNFLSDFTKKEILSSLKSYSVAGIVPEFVDLKFMYVEIDSTIYYNANFVGDPDNLRTQVVSAITSFAGGTELNKFGGRFKYSKILSLIDSVNTSITSNITTVRIRRNLNAKINQFAQYELCYDNTFYAPNSSYNIKSTGFSISGTVGTVYFSDEKIADTDKGNLVLFQIVSDADIKILSKSFGTIDYKKGEIIIDTVNITSTVQPNNIVEVQATPESNDVLARKELYLQFDVSMSNFYMRQDSIASGANTSGTRFDVQSSYSNGQKVRGAIISSTTGSKKLVGYVDGQPYFGPFHTMNNGAKMTGASHSDSSKLITSTPNILSDSSTSTSTSSSTPSSRSGSGY
tara:strand:- start:24946 stop:27054 length:2109 start_codon:yes stop_codon:yes gene_type:complete